MATTTTFTVLPWDGGQANVTAANTEHAKSPMTKLAKGSGWNRVSADGIYRYEREEHAGWFVQHVPSGEWITDLAGDVGAIGFSSCANARRWTHTSPVPADWTAGQAAAVTA
jgi:hypothetical protein